MAICWMEKFFAVKKFRSLLQRAFIDSLNKSLSKEEKFLSENTLQWIIERLRFSFESNLIFFFLRMNFSSSSNIFFPFSFLTSTSTKSNEMANEKVRRKKKKCEEIKSYSYFFLLLMYLNYIHRERKGGEGGGGGGCSEIKIKGRRKKKLNKTAINDNFYVSPVPEFPFLFLVVKIDMKTWIECREVERMWRRRRKEGE